MHIGCSADHTVHIGGGFADLSFDLVSGVLFCGEMFGQDVQFSIAIGRRSARDGGLQQALRDQIGIAAIWGGGMGIVLDREPKVPWSCVAVATPGRGSPSR